MRGDNANNGIVFAYLRNKPIFPDENGHFEDNPPHHDVGMEHFLKKVLLAMVEQPTKPVPTNLPTWWHRGPSGLVEEWETRVSEEEIARRQDRWRSVGSPRLNYAPKTSTPQS